MRSFVKLFLLLILTSCGSSKLVQVGTTVSKEGLEVSQNGIDTYTLLAEQRDIDASQRDIIKILTNPEPDKMALPQTIPEDFSGRINSRIKAYKSLLSVYQAFSLLTDSKYSADTQTATSAVLASYNSIKQLPQLSSGVSSIISGATGLITQSIQAKQIKKHNEILYNLTKVYLDLWNDEVHIWNDYVDRVYNEYVDGLKTVPTKYYDLNKVKDGNTEPYSDENILLLLYKIKQRNAIIKQKNDLKEQIANFGKALTQLNQAHAELSKDQSNITDVSTSLTNIEILIKAK